MKILLIQLRRIGDILLTTPVLPYIKQVMPSAKIDFLCEPCGQQVLETNQHLNKLLIYDKVKPVDEIKRVRQNKYDAVLDFMSNPRSTYVTLLSGAKWRVGPKKSLRRLLYRPSFPIPKEPEYAAQRKLRMTQFWLKRAGFQTPTPLSNRPQVRLMAADEAFAQSWIMREKIQSNDFVIFAPVSQYWIRTWRGEGYRDVGLQIAESGTRVYFAWGPGEKDAVEKICKGNEDLLRVLPPTTLRQMAAIIKKSRMVLSSSTGAMHLAVAMGTPTVTIYGPNRPIDWEPPDDEGSKYINIALTADGVPCLGCQLTDNCPASHICMTRLTEKRVWNACARILGKEGVYAR